MSGPKHQWVREDSGVIDIFAYDEGFHNGPRCEACGESFCHHCDPECYESECDAVVVVPESPARKAVTS